MSNALRRYREREERCKAADQQRIVVGARVKFAAKWLRSVGAMASAYTFQTGTVASVGGSCGQAPLVQVQWDDGHVSSALIFNLVCVDRTHMELA